MSEVGNKDNPLRVAIIGAGPTGFYAAEHLFKQPELTVEIDMIDRLPTPFGLVRAGVAPDHQKIKSVTNVFTRTAKKPGFRFFGNVDFGSDLTLEDLKNYYHQIIFCTGAQTDRYLNIPGADLKGHHPATEFVAWYNGHPLYRDYEFDLSVETAVVIGIGNVAMDVARILARSKEELAKTDIADYALEALAKSNIKEIYILGRRGPAQAAFTTPEIKELGEMEDADIFVLPEEAELDPLSEDLVAAGADRGTARKVQIIQGYSENLPSGKGKSIYLRLLVSPVEMIGDENGRLKKMRLVHNELYATEAGSLRPRATDKYEEIEAGIAFRSVGYRGVALPDVPFNENWGVILNDSGRVIDPDSEEPVTGLYTAGWIKRGPSGVIGTNKPDALETVEKMMADLAQGNLLQPAQPSASDAANLIGQRQPNYFSFEDWEKLDEIEVALGQESGRPRVKFTSIEDMMAVVNKKAAEPVT